MIVATPQPAITNGAFVDAKPVPAISAPLNPGSTASATEDLRLDSISFNQRGMSVSVTFPTLGHSMKELEEVRYEAPLLTRELPIQIVQQEGNSCGPTSMYMVLRALNRSCTIEEVEQETYYSRVIGTSPVHMQSAAAKFGFYSSLCNNISNHALTDLLDKGGYGIALLQKGGGLHYVVIHGYKIMRGQKLELEISDPNGYEYTESIESFDEEWKDVRCRGFDTGLNRLLIAVSASPTPKDSFDGNAALLSKIHATLNEIPTFFQTLGNLFATFFEGVSKFLLSMGGGLVPEKKRWD